MRTLLTVIMTLAAIFTVAQQSAPPETGTVIIVNISTHRTGKIEICEDKRTITKLGQHQWAEVSLPVGEHVLYPKITPNRRVVLKVSANTKQYITLDFSAVSYLPPVTDMQFRETTAIEGEHWIREYGQEKRVEAKER